MQATISCLRLAGDQNLRGQFHVAAAANAVIHAHDDVFALALEQPFVARARRFVHRGRQFRAAASAIRRAPSSNFPRAGPVARSGSSTSFFASLASAVARATSFCAASACSIKTISWSSILVMSALHSVDFVGERAVFLVLARLQLLVGVFLDLRFLRLDVEFEPFAVGLDLFDAVFGGVELALGAWRPWRGGFRVRGRCGRVPVGRGEFSGRDPAKSEVSQSSPALNCED